MDKTTHQIRCEQWTQIINCIRYLVRAISGIIAYSIEKECLAVL